jgi:uncharacterized protein (DUF2252 family)
MRAAHVVLALATAAAAACSEPEPDPRAAYLRTTLVDDNRVWIAREPALTAMKLQKMATRRFDYFRGTAGQYWRDVGGAGALAIPTAFGDGASALVWVLGDPHPENVGTFRATDGAMYVDWNDFDNEGWAPWWLDLRRLAAGIRVAGDELALDEVARDAMARAVAHGYADELARLAGGGAATPLVDGEIAADLLRRARDDGDSGEKLDDYTDVTADGRRVMTYGDLAPPRSDGVLDDTLALPTAAEDRLARSAVAHWAATPLAALPAGATAVKAVGRRLGAGVASFNGLRFYALLEGPSPDVDDDWLLEIKETSDGVHIPGLPLVPDVTAPSAGRRVVTAQRRLGLRADGDDLLGWADVAPLSFRVRHRTGYQKGLDVEDLVAPSVDQLAFATSLGALLARAHALAPTASGARGLDVIAPQVAGRAAELADETAAFAAVCDALVASDHLLLGALLAEHGPLLGAGRP